MRVKLKLARVGMNMEEATISRWLKKPGERFAKGDGLYEIETEKVNMTVEAPAAGTLVEILVAEGANATVGGEVCAVDLEPAAVASGGIS